MSNHPDCNLWQMDTIEGIKGRENKNSPSPPIWTLPSTAGGGGRGEARVCWRPGLGQPPPRCPVSTCIQRPSLVLSTGSPEPHPISAFLSRRCGGTRPREEAVLAYPLSTPCSARLVLTGCALSSQLLTLSGSWSLQRV